MSETPGTYHTSNSMSDTQDTEELKCLSLIEVMAIPQERREIALGTLRAIKERDEALRLGNKLADECERILGLGLHQNTIERFKSALNDWKEKTK